LSWLAIAAKHRAGQVLEARRLRLLAEIGRRSTFARDGHLSATSWLAARYRVAFPHAAQQVKTAAALEDMPGTREALASGELSSSAVASLVSAHDTSPEEFSRAEGLLVRAAQSRRPRSFTGPSVNGGARSMSDRPWKRPGVSGSAGDWRCPRSPRGWSGWRGTSNPRRPELDHGSAGGHRRRGAVRGPDPRTPTQRRADALGEVCRGWLDRADRPTVGGERPQVVVVVEVEALQRRSGGTAELSDVGSVPAEIARMVGCDASISRVVRRGASEPLDVGRKTPVVPAAIRRAIMVRDRGCRFPGCDRPPGWCQPHHIIHWAHGGKTALSNLILLCSRHHRIMHVEGFRVELATNGRTRFFRPDGRVLEDRAPP
jgi:uncharacterized protein DUF222/HNH endonuclease